MSWNGLTNDLGLDKKPKSKDYGNIEYLSDVFATVETSGDKTKEYLQMEKPTFADMQRAGHLDKKEKFEDYVKIENGKRSIANKEKYKDLTLKTYNYLQDVFGIDTPEEAALYLYRPAYKKRYGSVENIPKGLTGSFGKDSKTVMENRKKSLEKKGFDLSFLNPFAATPAYADEDIPSGWGELEPDLNIQGKSGEGWGSLDNDLGISGTQTPEKRQYLKHLGESLYKYEVKPSIIQPYKTFMGAAETAFAGTLRPLATAYDFYADIISNATGIGDADKKRWLEKVYDSYRTEGAQLLSEGMPEQEFGEDDSTFLKTHKAVNNVTRAAVKGVGALAWKIPELMSMAKFLSVGGMGSLTFATTEGLEATPEGGKEAAKQAAIGYGFQGIVKGISLLPRAVQLPTAFTTFGGVTLASGGTYEEAVGSGILGIGLSMMGRAPSMKEFRSRYADVEWQAKFNRALGRRMKAKSIREYRAWRKDAGETIGKFGSKKNLEAEVRRVLQRGNRKVTDADVKKAVNDIRNLWGKQVADANRSKQGGMKLLTPEELLGFGKQIEQDMLKDMPKVGGQKTGIEIVQEQKEKTPISKKYEELVKKGDITQHEVDQAKQITKKQASKAIKKVKQGREITGIEQQAIIDTVEMVTEEVEAKDEKVLQEKIPQEKEGKSETFTVKDSRGDDVEVQWDLSYEGHPELKWVGTDKSLLTNQEMLDQHGKEQAAELLVNTKFQKEKLKQHNAKVDEIIAKGGKYDSEEDVFNMPDGSAIPSSFISEQAVEIAKDVEAERQSKLVKIPKFKNTEQAIEFGKKATPEEVKELKARRKKTQAKIDKLKAKDEEDDGMTDAEMQEAMDLAVEGQFYREAIESAEGTIKKPKIDKKAEKKPVEETKEAEYTHEEESREYRSLKVDLGSDADNWLRSLSSFIKQGIPKERILNTFIANLQSQGKEVPGNTSLEWIGRRIDEGETDFSKYEKPKKEIEYTVTKADIIPTREGYKAVVTSKEKDKVEVVPKEEIDKFIKAGEKKEDLTPFKFQDTNQEKIIHSDWTHNALRHDLEGAGDIFRELAKNTNDDSYIAEKVRRLERLFEGYDDGTLHSDDTLEGAWVYAKDKMSGLIAAWKKQPVKTPEQQIAKDLNIALLNKDIPKAKELVNQIKALEYNNDFQLKIKEGEKKLPEVIIEDKDIVRAKEIKRQEVSAASIINTVKEYGLPDAWLGHVIKERVVKHKIHEITQDDAETERIFNILKAEEESATLKEKGGEDAKDKISKGKGGDVGERGISDSGEPTRDTGNSLESSVNRERRKDSFDSTSELTREENLGNYKITSDDNIGEGGAKTKYKANVTAIKLLKKLEEEKRKATPEEQAILVKYTGWGGLSKVFEYRWNAGDFKEESEEIKELLTDQEFKQARASTINAHYTSPEVIKAMWEAVSRLGFNKGKVIEPAMGVGHFLGLSPQTHMAFTGVELDSLSGRIAQHLYQHSDIHVSGYQDVNLPSNFYDLAISNVPFSDYKPFDKRAKTLGIPKGLVLHDYFFAKSLALLKPGGIMAFITSKGTMDKQTKTFREYLSKKSELLGAVRLPNTAFKQMAGTEVVTDVIFLRKLYKDEEPIKSDWVDSVEFTQGDKTVFVNKYYIDNPNAVIGELAIGSGLYADAELTVNPHDMDMAEEMRTALLDILPKNIKKESLNGEGHDVAETEIILPAKDVKEGAFVVKGAKVYKNEENVLKEYTVTPEENKRISGMAELRDTVRDLLSKQVYDKSDASIKSSMAKLNKQYDAFVKKFGNLNDRRNESAFSDDPDYPLLASLETTDKNIGKKQTYKKTEIFTKRVLLHHKKPTSAKNVVDAYYISLGEYSRLNWEYMSELVNKPVDTIIAELLDKGLILKNPEGEQYELAEEYLAGNVKLKLKQAISASKIDPTYSRNIKALKPIIPEDLTFDQISVKMGMPWINPSTFTEFLNELGVWNTKVMYNNVDGSWLVNKERYFNSGSTANKSEWGTSRVPATVIFEMISNSKPIKVFDTFTNPDGTKYKVFNEDQTALAEDKAELMRDKFNSWFWDNEERREYYLKHYNEDWNNTVNRKYDGSHLVFPGLNPAAFPDGFRKTQINAIWRGITNNRMMMAHEVGAGKTATAIAIAMESKRLGLINKTMIVAQKSITPGWRKEINRMYPSAKVLIADERNFSASRRKKFVAKIATGDWDIIVIPESSFERIKVSPEAFEEYMTEEINDLREIKRQLKEAGAKVSIKNIESAIFKKEAKLKAALDESKRDDTMIFEELGIDSLIVDEADRYKNLSYTTRKQGIKGMGTALGNNKTADMMMKSRIIHKKNGKMIFATGTPVSNSMVEVHAMMKYLQPELLEERGLKSFDAWSNAYGEVISALEVDVTGGQYKTVSRFSKFVNVPELMSMIRTVWDVQTSEMLEEQGVLVKGKNLPMIKGGKPEALVIPSYPNLEEYILHLIDRADEIKKRKGKPQKGDDILLVVLSDGLKASVDMRMIDPTLPKNENSKVEVAIKGIYEKYKETNKDKGAQVVFIDRVAPNKSVKFNPHYYMKKELVKKGIPEKEIAFIHDYPTDEKKAVLFESVNSGDIRVLFGSTEKMGAGVNVQKRLAKLWHLDIPYRPRDIKQREGRIIRPGNSFAEIEIARLATKGSLDTFMFQMLEAKSKSIDQILGGQSSNRVMVEEEINEYEALKSLSSTNPLVKEKSEIDKKVRKLKALENAYLKEKFKAEQDVKNVPESINNYEQMIKDREKLIKDRPAERLTKDTFEIEVKDITYNDKKEALEKIYGTFSKIGLPDYGKTFTIGEYLGKPLVIRKTFNQNTDKIQNSLGIEGVWGIVSEDPTGTFSSLDNAIFSQPEKDIASGKGTVQELNNRLNHAKKLTEEGFSKQGEMSEAILRQAEVNRLLKKEVEGTETEEVQQTRKEDEVRKQLEKDEPDDISGLNVGMSFEDVSEPGWEDEEVKEKATMPRVESDTMKTLLKPFKKANDYLFTFGEQKRIDPKLYNKLMDSYHELSSRVENSIIGTEKVLGKTYTSTDRAEITFGVEEKSYQVPKHLEEVTNEIRRIRDELEKILLDDDVIKTGFIERELNELNEKQIIKEQKVDTLISLLSLVPEKQKAKRKRIEKRIEKAQRELALLEKDIAQVEDLEFLTHRAVAKAVMQLKVDKMSDNNRTAYLANLRRVSFKYKHRAGIIPLRVFYQNKLLKKEDVDIFNILSQMLSEAQFRLTLKGLFDFYRENDYVYHRNKKKVPSHYQRFNPIVTGLIAPEYKNYWIHPLALSGLMEIKEGLTTRSGVLKAIFSAVKSGQFVVPTIVWRYDILQAAFGGSLGFKSHIYLAKAVKDVMNKSEFFQRANKGGVFQQAYLPVVGGRSETEMIQLAARQTLKDIPWAYKMLENLLGMRMKQEDSLQVLLASFRALSKFTWTGDRILRLASVYAYKDQEYSDKDAFNMAAQIHGAYADISPKARRHMSWIFFVHSFRILMPRFIWRIIYEPVKMVGGSLGGGKKYSKKDWIRVSKGLAMFLLIPFLIDYYFTKTRGFKREVPLWKYYKEIDDEYEVVVSLNYIINNPVKYLSRLSYYDPTRKETQVQQALTKFLKWEVHPIYRIMGDVLKNRKSIGYGRVYDESDSMFNQHKDITKYAIMESFRILDWVFAEPDEAEGYSLTKAEQKELIEKEVKGVEGAITDWFGYKYVRKQKGYFKALAYKRLESEVYRRMRYANSQEKRDKVQLWYDKTKEWVDKTYKE